MFNWFVRRARRGTGATEDELPPELAALGRELAAADAAGVTPAQAIEPVAADGAATVVAPGAAAGDDALDSSLLAVFQEEAPVETVAARLAGTVDAVDAAVLAAEARALLRRLGLPAPAGRD